MYHTVGLKKKYNNNHVMCVWVSQLWASYYRNSSKSSVNLVAFGLKMSAYYTICIERVNEWMHAQICKIKIRKNIAWLPNRVIWKKIISLFVSRQNPISCDSIRNSHCVRYPSFRRTTVSRRACISSHCSLQWTIPN